MNKEKSVSSIYFFVCVYIPMWVYTFVRAITKKKLILSNCSNRKFTFSGFLRFIKKSSIVHRWIQASQNERKKYTYLCFGNASGDLMSSVFITHKKDAYLLTFSHSHYFFSLSKFF